MVSDGGGNENNANLGWNSLVAEKTEEQKQFMHAETIRTVTLDEYVTDHNIDCIDAMKIDTEGFEANVVQVRMRVFRTRTVHPQPPTPPTTTHHAPQHVRGVDGVQARAHVQSLPLLAWRPAGFREGLAEHGGNQLHAGAFHRDRLGDGARHTQRLPSRARHVCHPAKPRVRATAWDQRRPWNLGRRPLSTLAPSSEHDFVARYCLRKEHYETGNVIGTGCFMFNMFQKYYKSVLKARACPACACFSKAALRLR